MQIVITYHEQEIYCYGKLQESSNFEVVCADESLDDVWCDGNPTGGYFTSWIEVVEGLWEEFEGSILEISAV